MENKVTAVWFLLFTDVGKLIMREIRTRGVERR